MKFLGAQAQRAKYRETRSKSVLRGSTVGRRETATGVAAVTASCVGYGEQRHKAFGIDPTEDLFPAWAGRTQLCQTTIGRSF
jgi:hypothetical protein